MTELAQQIIERETQLLDKYKLESQQMIERVEFLSYVKNWQKSKGARKLNNKFLISSNRSAK